MAIKDRLPSTDALLDALPLPRDFLTRLGVLAGQTTRRISIDSVAVAGGNLSDVEISKINLGNASIGTITIENTEATLKQSSAFLSGVKSIVELKFKLKWEIDLGWIGHWGDTNNIGSIDIPVDLGNIDIPSLDNIDLSIPTINIPAIVANMEPIKNLKLGNFSLTGADIQKLSLPSAGLSITGLGVGDVEVSSLAVPSVNSQALTVAQAKPDLNVVLPGATVNNLSIPETSIPSIASSPFSTRAVASDKSLTVNLGLLKITLSVTPTVYLNVAAMTIKDAKLSASLGSVKIKDISLPVSVHGLSATAFEANGLSVNHIKF